MKKDKLEKAILKYSGVATAVLGASAAQGQVVWTDIPDTIISTNGGSYNVNIDQDTAGIVDFRIVQVIDSLSSAFDVTGVLIKDGPNGAGNQVLGLDYGNYNYAFRLGLGDTIGAKENFKGIHSGRNTGYLGLEAAGNGYPNSQWVDTTNGVKDGFLGVRFKADRNDTIRNFYGWIRIDIAKNLESFTVKGFAYQEIWDSSITAGLGSDIGIEDFEVEKPELAQRGLLLDINLPETYNPQVSLNIVDLSGRSINSQELIGYRNTVELENLPKGILIATVSSNGIQTSKKIVIY